VVGLYLMLGIWLHSRGMLPRTCCNTAGSKGPVALTNPSHQQQPLQAPVAALL
jgi:hypothetical protein